MEQEGDVQHLQRAREGERRREERGVASGRSCDSRLMETTWMDYAKPDSHLYSGKLATGKVRLPLVSVLNSTLAFSSRPSLPPHPPSSRFPHTPSLATQCDSSEPSSSAPLRSRVWSRRKTLTMAPPSSLSPVCRPPLSLARSTSSDTPPPVSTT